MEKDQCSVWAYEEINKSGYVSKVQSWVLSILAGAYPGSMTMPEVVDQIQIEFNPTQERACVSSRFSELERMGFLDKFKLKVNPKSNKTVNAWRWTGRKEPLPCRDEIVSCPNCQGRGTVIRKVFVHPENYQREFQYV
jgi:hypothetical protein